MTKTNLFVAIVLTFTVFSNTLLFAGEKNAVNFTCDFETRKFAFIHSAQEPIKYDLAGLIAETSENSNQYVFHSPIWKITVEKEGYLHEKTEPPYNTMAEKWFVSKHKGKVTFLPFSSDKLSIWETVEESYDGECEGQWNVNRFSYRSIGHSDRYGSKSRLNFAVSSVGTKPFNRIKFKKNYENSRIPEQIIATPSEALKLKGMADGIKVDPKIWSVVSSWSTENFNNFLKGFVYTSSLLHTCYEVRKGYQLVYLTEREYEAGVADLRRLWSSVSSELLKKGPHLLESPFKEFDEWYPLFMKRENKSNYFKTWSSEWDENTRVQCQEHIAALSIFDNALELMP